MDSLRKDWVKLDKARGLLEDGPIDYLTDEDLEKLLGILCNCETNIKDILSVKELSRISDME